MDGLYKKMERMARPKIVGAERNAPLPSPKNKKKPRKKKIE